MAGAYGEKSIQWTTYAAHGDVPTPDAGFFAIYILLGDGLLYMKDSSDTSVTVGSAGTPGIFTKAANDGAVATPSAGDVALYFLPDDQFHYKDEGGTVLQVGSLFSTYAAHADVPVPGSGCIIFYTLGDGTVWYKNTSDAHFQIYPAAVSAIGILKGIFDDAIDLAAASEVIITRTSDGGSLVGDFDVSSNSQIVITSDSEGDYLLTAVLCFSASGINQNSVAFGLKINSTAEIQVMLSVTGADSPEDDLIISEYPVHLTNGDVLEFYFQKNSITPVVSNSSTPIWSYYVLKRAS